jgi:alpha-1,3-rhamnosyl/mannosyltransferase
VLRDCGARVYHSPYYLMPLAPGAPTIVNCWDLIPLVVPGLFGTARRLIFRAAHMLAFHAARLVVVPTEATRKDVVRFFPRSSRRKLQVVPLGSALTVTLSDEEAEARRGALGVPSAYLLYAGSNKPHKNLPLRVEAWAGALRADPGATSRLPLVVAGPSDRRYPAAGAAARARGIGDRVLEVGHVDEATLAALYAGARLFVFPSRHEGFGLPVVEAMARGVPVICARTPALLEVAGDAAAWWPGGKDTGGLATLIVRLLRDAAERERLRDAGLSRAAGFTWKATACAMAGVYGRAEQSR